MKIKRKIIEIDESMCDGCGACVTDCKEGALEIVDGKAKVVKESFCDGLGACIGSCPTGALKIIEREAARFDEAAAAGNQGAGSNEPQKPCVCPGGAPRSIAGRSSENDDRPQKTPVSRLKQWPIQLRLVPATGPLFHDRDVLLLADCVAVACPDLHLSFLKDKTVVMACPKLDSSSEIAGKLAEIFKNPIRSVTIAIIEVPCCNGLVMLAGQAKKVAGATFPVEVVRVAIDGGIIERFMV